MDLIEINDLSNAIKWLVERQAYIIPVCSQHDTLTELRTSAAVRSDKLKWVCPEPYCRYRKSLKNSFFPFEYFRHAPALVIFKLLFVHFATDALPAKLAAKCLKAEGFKSSINLATRVYDMSREFIGEWVASITPKYIVRPGGVVAVEKERLLSDVSGKQHWAVVIIDMDNPNNILVKPVADRTSKALVGAIRDTVPTKRKARTNVITNTFKSFRRLKDYEYNHVIGYDIDDPEHPAKKFWNTVKQEIGPYKSITATNRAKMVDEAMWRVHCKRNGLSLADHLLSLIKIGSVDISEEM